MPIDLVAKVTKVVREADEQFEKEGGSSRHWVRDCFLPTLSRYGLKIVEEANWQAPGPSPYEPKRTPRMVPDGNR